MRFAASIFVAAHGIGFSIWFMSAWAPATLAVGSKHLTLLPDARATGPIGKAVGIVALGVLAGFLVSAWGIWQQASWWPFVLTGSALASLPVAFAVWNPVGVVSVLAMLASAGLLAATVMPWGERFLGPH